MLLVKQVHPDHKEFLEKLDVLVKQERRDPPDLLERKEKQESPALLGYLDFQGREGCRVCR